MLVNTYKHNAKIMTKILQGSAVIQTLLGGLTIYPPVANFLVCISKNYENWLAVDKISRLTFSAHPVYKYSVNKQQTSLHQLTLTREWFIWTDFQRQTEDFLSVLRVNMSKVKLYVRICIYKSDKCTLSKAKSTNQTNVQSVKPYLQVRQVYRQWL